MKNSLKGTLITVLALLLIGGGVMGVGYAMGGRGSNGYLQWNGHGIVFNSDNDARNDETGASRSEILSSAQYDSLELNVGAVDVDIVEGDDFVVSANTSHYSVENKGGTLYVSTDDVWDGANGRITITVPKDAVLEWVSLSFGAGRLKADGLQCKTAQLSVGMGTMELLNFTCTGACDIEVGAGRFSLDGALRGASDIEVGLGTAELKVRRPESFGYSIECGMGSVEVDGRRYNGIGYDESRNETEPVFFDIDCGMGNVQLNFV